MSAIRRSQGAGFTLIEVLAAIFLTSMVIAGAVAFQINLTSATSRAADLTREGRQAVGVLDRVARDLQTAYLVVKPEDTDPLEHPWLFLGEDRSQGEGSDRVKFMSRGLRPRGSVQHSGDLGAVAYLLRDSEEGEGYDLMRWSQPGLPDGLDRDFPSPEDDGVFVVAEAVQHFGVRFLAEDGEWASEWDSSQLTDSAELPIAAEIQLALLDPNDLEGEDEPVQYKRRVVLPVRPIDLVSLIQGGGPDGSSGEGDGEDEDGESDDDEDGDGDGGGSGGGDPVLQACMSSNRAAIVSAIGQVDFDRYFSASPGTLDHQFAMAALAQAGVSCE